MHDSTSKNLHYLFYRNYYAGLSLHTVPSDKDKSTIHNRNRQLVSMQPALYDTTAPSPLTQLPGFCKIDDLQTLYPGLLVGTGYPHNVGVTGEFQMGCTLDYVTGLPYIPGSGVKGTLRAAFQDAGFIQELLGEIGVSRSVCILSLEHSIFGERTKEAFQTGQRDIFLDAFPFSVEDTLLSTDAITPHQNSLLKSPIPLPMLKVSSGVGFCFRFILHDDILSSEEKCKLFRLILCYLGVGAKTNVGYGHFTVKENMPCGYKTPVSAAPTGKCQRCGAPTGIDKNGQYYPLCGKCVNAQRSKAKPVYPQPKGGRR